MLLIGKPSISMGHFHPFSMAMLNHQRVTPIFALRTMVNPRTAGAFFSGPAPASRQRRIAPAPGQAETITWASESPNTWLFPYKNRGQMAVSLQNMWKNDGKLSFHYKKCGIYHGLPSKLEGFTTIIMEIYHDVRKNMDGFTTLQKKYTKVHGFTSAQKAPSVPTGSRAPVPGQESGISQPNGLKLEASEQNALPHVLGKP